MNELTTTVRVNYLASDTLGKERGRQHRRREVLWYLSFEQKWHLPEFIPGQEDEKALAASFRIWLFLVDGIKMHLHIIIPSRCDEEANRKQRQAVLIFQHAIECAPTRSVDSFNYIFRPYMHPETIIPTLGGQMNNLTRSTCGYGGCTSENWRRRRKRSGSSEQSLIGITPIVCCCS